MPWSSFLEIFIKKPTHLNGVWLVMVFKVDQINIFMLIVVQITRWMWWFQLWWQKIITWLSVLASLNELFGFPQCTTSYFWSRALTCIIFRPSQQLRLSSDKPTSCSLLNQLGRPGEAAKEPDIYIMIWWRPVKWKYSENWIGVHQITSTQLLNVLHLLTAN